MFWGEGGQEHSTAGIPKVTAEICHFQVKNNCSRDYKYGTVSL